MGINVAVTLAPSFLIGSSSFFLLMETRKPIKPKISSKFGQNRSRTLELAALKRL